MPSFSTSSLGKLETCHPLLQQLFRAVILDYDCTVIEGHRSHLRQTQLYGEGKSKVTVSKHNTVPSNAIDVGPYIMGRGIPWPQVPKDWTNRSERDQYIKDFNQWYHFVGFVMAKAKDLNINLRSGADWDRDNNISDQSFNDLPHFEIGGF